MFFKVGALKNFANIYSIISQYFATPVLESLILIKLQASRPFLENTSGRLLLGADESLTSQYVFSIKNIKDVNILENIKYILKPYWFRQGTPFFDVGYFGHSSIFFKYNSFILLRNKVFA